MLLKELKEILNSLPDEYENFHIDICLIDYNEENDNYLYGKPYTDWLEQIQIINSKRKIILHSDYTSVVGYDGIYTVIDENEKPVDLMG